MASRWTHGKLPVQTQVDGPAVVWSRVGGRQGGPGGRCREGLRGGERNRRAGRAGRCHCGLKRWLTERNMPLVTDAPPTPSEGVRIRSYVAHTDGLKDTG